MPQLDPLAYFHQYVYLLMTFVAVYFFVLSYIIPKVVSTLKIRRKLNSIHLLTNKIGQPTLQLDSSNLQQSLVTMDTLFLQYDHLLLVNWKSAATKGNNNWLQSTRALQLSQTFRLKKLFLDNIVRRITKLY